MFTHGAVSQGQDVATPRNLDPCMQLLSLCCLPYTTICVYNALQCEVNCRDTCHILFTAYNTQDIDLCCVTLNMFSFAVCIFLRCILTSSMTEFSFAPRNISVQCSTALVRVGCRALTFQQLPVTTELPITDKLSLLFKPP